MTTRRGRPPRVTREAILEAVDARGSDFTMASIAAELGVSEPAIYYHFPSKQALLLELGAQLLGGLRLPSSDLEWEPWLEELALGVFAFARSHPLLNDVDLSAAMTAQAAGVRLLDQVLGHLVACGFTADSAVLALAAVLAVVQPMALSQADHHRRAAAADYALRHDIAVVAGAPLAASLYAASASHDSEATLRQLLRVVLSGIRGELAPKPLPRARRGRS